MMQRFDLVMADPSYELRIKQAMTVKPFNFQIHVLPRKDRSGHYAAIPAPIVTKSLDTTALPSTASTEGKQRVYVLYGSNTGTSEAFAQRIISAAPVHGKLSRLCRGFLQMQTWRLCRLLGCYGHFRRICLQAPFERAYHHHHRLV